MTAGKSMLDYATEFSTSDASSGRMVALWHRGLAYDNRSQGKLDWYYRDNPEGWPLVAFLLHGAEREAIGVAATGTRRMRHGPDTIRAGMMVDFVVVEAHRTLFPAIFLQKGICRRALERHDLLYGFPNPQSLAAIRRAGYRPVGAMVRRARVLRSASYLGRYLPAWASRAAGAVVDRAFLAAEALRRLGARGYRTAWLDRPDERFDGLWARAATADTLMGVRDRRFLEWRFAECPFGTHRFFTVVCAADGTLAAYAACVARDRVLQVSDFLVDPAHPGAWTRLWSDLTVAAYRGGSDSLGVSFLGAEALQQRLSSAGLIARERQHVYAVLPGAFAELADGSRWYLTNADDDD